MNPWDSVPSIPGRHRLIFKDQHIGNIESRDDGWYAQNKGPFPSAQKAAQILYQRVQNPTALKSKLMRR